MSISASSDSVASPADPTAGPAAGHAAAGRGRDATVRTTILAALAVAVVLSLLGAPIGLLWRALAPQVELVRADDGWYTVQSEPEGYFADDGWFVVVGAVAGVLVAVAAWLLLRRYRGIAVLAGLVVGSAAGAVLGAWIGHHIGLAAYERLIHSAPTGTHLRRPANLRISDVGLWFGFLPRVRGILLVQAFFAVATYTLLAAFNPWPSLRQADDSSALAAALDADTAGAEAVGGDVSGAEAVGGEVSGVEAVGGEAAVSSGWSEPPGPPGEWESPAPGPATPPRAAEASAHRADG